MPLALAQLPPDIILLICIHLHPKDLLSFIQTCRVVHALASTDYVWHHVNNDLPLDGVDTRLTSISGPEIKSRVMRALRLDNQWRRPGSRISRIRKINTQATVVQMRTLGRDWLLISSRAAASSISLSVWRLDMCSSCTSDMSVIPSSRVISFEPMRAFQFEASFQEDKYTALICILGGSPTVPHKGQLSIYHLNLKGHESQDNPLGAPFVMNKWTLEHSGLVYYAQISGPIVAAAIVRILDASYNHQILLFNTKTNITVRIGSPDITNFECGRMQFKIYSRHIVIVGVYKGRIKVHVRELPREIFSTRAIPQPLDEEMIPTTSWESVIVDYETPKIRTPEISITSEPIYYSSLESFTVMANYFPLSETENGIVNVYHFPIDVSKHGLKFTDWGPTYSFATPPNVSLDPACIGKTGYRAVWLSHQWEIDDFRLLKASFPINGEPHFVEPLQPPEMPLPFEPHTCRSLYFEEATGRLFVGVHTGEIYLLEF
ncbi:hypothetical protein GALMADRAFT_247460 [Galerina marginata CBS 339.88]|uniref:F-box domain-containing protein n=1 Tax=Galerina marginata (strain CBS 339.88) TaxID=685588 RepID=A0A067SZ82_GALM3|nr:hypothetical protein GALMADRAFT_247460 [Galerina marginata CBS 339.88]